MFCPLFLLVIAIIPQEENAVDFDATRTPALTANQIADGWLALFDGQSMYGWRAQKNANWKTVDGTLVSEQIRQNAELIRTAAQFDNFQLKFDFAVSKDAKSSLFIRTSPNPVDNRDCLEILLAAADGAVPAGSIFGSHDEVAKVVPVNIGKDNWNQMDIRANVSTIRIRLNDVEVVRFSAKHQIVKKGFVGLLSEQGSTQVRNMIIQPLLTDQFFDAGLANWIDKESRESKFVFQSRDSKPADQQTVLRMTSGPGQLETRNEYDNFIFFSHIRTNAIGLNSGIFFRCIPGQFMNGYESQIQNQFNDNDRMKPFDCGTGGIFRRQNARIVNGDDKNWFAKTIIVDGATICVWINGLQVTDWTDKRKSNLNPRKGRRLEAGTIILQGHDPTTDVSFRAMKIRRLESRR